MVNRLRVWAGRRDVGLLTPPLADAMQRRDPGFPFRRSSLVAHAAVLPQHPDAMLAQQAPSGIL